MSFWNLLLEAAFFNEMRKLVFGKSKSERWAENLPCDNTYPDTYTATADDARISELERYISQKKKDIANHRKMMVQKGWARQEIFDAEDIRDRIDELEDELTDCDPMSTRCERIESEISRLQKRLDEIDDILVDDE